MMPSKGPTPETCQFTTPKDLPEGTYNLFVSAVGVQSKQPMPFTVGVGTTGVVGDAGSAADAGGSGDDSSTESEASTPSGGESASSSGAGGAQNGAGTDAGGAAGQGGGPAGRPPSSGCACHASDDSSRRGSPVALGIAGLVLAGWRRRRARRT